jgi:hypothetical protein
LAHFDTFRKPSVDIVYAIYETILALTVAAAHVSRPPIEK